MAALHWALLLMATKLQSLVWPLAGLLLAECFVWWWKTIPMSSCFLGVWFERTRFPSIRESYSSGYAKSIKVSKVYKHLPLAPSAIFYLSAWPELRKLSGWMQGEQGNPVTWLSCHSPPSGRVTALVNSFGDATRFSVSILFAPDSIRSSVLGGDWCLHADCTSLQNHHGTSSKISETFLVNCNSSILSWLLPWL